MAKLHIRLVREAPCLLGAERANGAGEAARHRPVGHKQATHVEADAEVRRDAGSIPAASTFQGPALARRPFAFCEQGG